MSLHFFFSLQYKDGWNRIKHNTGSTINENQKDFI